MKRTLAIFVMLVLTTLFTPAYSQKSFFDFKVKDINGKEFDFSTLKGKKVLVVNTASKCGNTPQYADLEKLYNQYRKDGFVIVGFPANNFGGQEPGNNQQIEEFCQKNYSVTFPMMGKSSVKGNDMNEVYKWLTEKKENGKMDSEVTWNFQKYFIDPDGSLAGYVSPTTLPYNDKIINWINAK